MKSFIESLKLKKEKNKKNKLHYDAIFFFETHFQKIIIDFLIENKYNDKEILLIDATGDQLKLNNKRAFCDLSRISKIFRSYNSIQILKNLSCNQLIGSHVSSHKTRIFSSAITHQHLILTDDGIGTPVIIQDKKFYWKTRNSFTFLIKIPIIEFLFLINKKHFFFLAQILKRIDYYYYAFLNPTLIASEKINPFNQISNLKLIEGTGFLGTPFIEDGFMTKESYIDMIKKIIYKENTLIYYPHPCEKWYIGEKIEKLVFVDKKYAIEEYIRTNPIPNKLIGFKSTAMLTLKLIAPNIQTYYIDIKADANSIMYDHIMKLHNINKYDQKITSKLTKSRFNFFNAK